jgi:DNA polymerase-3 subunit delta
VTLCVTRSRCIAGAWPWSARASRADAGVNALFRAGFGFMHRGLMESQLKAWSSARLGALIEPLRDAQTRARANAVTAQMEAERALWRVAKAAGRR